MALEISQISFPLKVPKISELKSIDSPDVILLNVPWRVSIHKNSSSVKQWLSIYLHCSKKDKTSEWVYPANLTVKLKSFVEEKMSIEQRCEPFIFEKSGTGFGKTNFIEWHNLIDPTKGYLKNDTIELEIKIEIAEQNCHLTFNTLDKCCENSSMAKYQLTVTNIDKLMAVQSPKFEMMKLPWNFTVYKSSTACLAIRLRSMLKVDDGAKICSMRVSFKLLSFKANKDLNKIIQTKSIKNGCSIESKEIISWKNLLNPQCSYVENNIIKIEIKMEANSEDMMAIDNNVAKKSQLECVVCFECLKDQDVSSATCGHLFCSVCIAESIKICNACPSCKTPITTKNVHRVYLPL